MKNIFKMLIMLTGYIGLSQSERGMTKGTTVTFPNGDESIVITTGEKTNMLQLTNNSQTDRFEGLELSNHEVVHQKGLPGFSPEPDSLGGERAEYSLYREEEDTQSENSDPQSEA
jgi:hypothetical protein